MTRAILPCVLGLGLIGGLLAQSASAQSYAVSTRNPDGSRTMCGRTGCTTVPATSIYSRTGALEDSYRHGYRNAEHRFGVGNDWRYGNRDLGRSNGYGYPGEYAYGRAGADRVSYGYDSWRNERLPYSNTLPARRTVYDDYRYDNYRGYDNSRYGYVAPTHHGYDRCSPNY